MFEIFSWISQKVKLVCFCVGSKNVIILFFNTTFAVVNAPAYPVAQMKPLSSPCPGILDGKESMILLMRYLWLLHISHSLWYVNI